MPFNSFLSKDLSMCRLLTIVAFFGWSRVHFAKVIKTKKCAHKGREVNMDVACRDAQFNVF